MPATKGYPSRISSAIRAFLIHFGLSGVVFAAVAFIVFKVWFPYPFDKIAGGINLFLLLILVDVFCGPLLTSIVYSPQKTKRERFFDILLIVVIQLAAFGYGIYSIALARPAVVAYEVDRFVVVSAAQIDPDLLINAPENLKNLSWAGPQFIGTRLARSDEILQSVQESLAGIEPSARPSWWQSLEATENQIKARMLPLEKLQSHLTREDLEVLNTAVSAIQKNSASLYFVPLVGKESTSWIVLLNSDAKIIGYAPVSGFYH